MPVPAAHVKGLHRYEHQLLLVLERLMRKYRWVPLDLLKRASGLSEGELSYRLGSAAAHCDFGSPNCPAVPRFAHLRAARALR